MKIPESESFRWRTWHGEDAFELCGPVTGLFYKDKNLCLFSHRLFSRNSGTLGSPRLSLIKPKCLMALPVHPSCWSCQKQVTFWDACKGAVHSDWSNSCPSSPRPFMTTTTWGWGWNVDPVLPGTVPVNHLSLKATGQEKTSHSHLQFCSIPFRRTFWALILWSCSLFAVKLQEMRWWSISQEQSCWFSLTESKQLCPVCRIPQNDFFVL